MTGRSLWHDGRPTHPICRGLYLYRLRVPISPSAAGENHHGTAMRTAAIDLARLSAPANAAGVPSAPAHASETLQVRCDRPLSSPLMGSDASLRFRDLSLQVGYGFFCVTGRTGDLANRKLSSFQGFHGVTVLLELNPMPSDVAIAVSNHVAAAHGDRLVLSFRMVKHGRLWLTIG